MRFNQTPNWRWERAQQLVTAKAIPSRSGDDKWVKRAYRFNKRQRRNSPRAEQHLASDHPDIHNAFQVYANFGSNMRWLLEAGIIANKEQAMLADYLRMDVPAIEAYEKLFFDVRDALANRGCIYANVLSLGMNGFVPASPDIMWKMVAYAGGFEAVQAAFEMGSISNATMEFFSQSWRDRVTVNAQQAAYVNPVNQFNGVDLQRLAFDMMVKQDEDGTTHRGDAVSGALGGLITSIKMTVLPTKAKLAAEEPRVQPLVLPMLPANIEEGKK